MNKQTSKKNNVKSKHSSPYFTQGYDSSFSFFIFYFFCTPIF
uniref:Uncharacterized protein n=1 Tax=Anguilla anguilla TaxID=7936 RepID=A0A0E9WTW7_ANGAN